MIFTVTMDIQDILLWMRFLMHGFVFNLIKVQDMRTGEMKLEDDNASFLGPNFPRLTANCQAVICEQGCI